MLKDYCKIIKLMIAFTYLWRGDVLGWTPNYVSKKFKLVKLILSHLT